MESYNMNARATKKLVAGGALGAMLIGTVALASAATADPGDTSDIDVSVEVESNVEPGHLAMSVAGSSATLEEAPESSVEGAREFNGVLPTVTITDTRTAEEIPDGAYWSVLGQATDFVNVEDPTKTIGAEFLGWTPAVVQAEETGLVMPGEETVSELAEPTSGENNVGLVNQELFVSSWATSEDAVGTYAANAALNLIAPDTVAAGSYTSKITLSLFEDIG